EIVGRHRLVGRIMRNRLLAGLGLFHRCAPRYYIHQSYSLRSPGESRDPPPNLLGGWGGRWIGILRPSRRPLQGLLRMTLFLIFIIDLHHPEEAAERLSRRTHHRLSEGIQDRRSGGRISGARI